MAGHPMILILNANHVGKRTEPGEPTIGQNDVGAMDEVLQMHLHPVHVAAIQLKAGVAQLTTYHLGLLRSIIARQQMERARRFTGSKQILTSIRLTLTHRNAE